MLDYAAYYLVYLFSSSQLRICLLLFVLQLYLYLILLSLVCSFLSDLFNFVFFLDSLEVNAYSLNILGTRGILSNLHRDLYCGGYLGVLVRFFLPSTVLDQVILPVQNVTRDISIFLLL